MTENDDSYLQLISLAVHEFRTPASVVSGYLRMLLRDSDHPLTDRQRKMIEEAERSCQRLSTIVAELSEVQKLDAELVEPAQQRFDVFEVISGVAEDVHEAEDRDVRLEIRGPSEGAPIHGDLTRLQRAFAAIFRAVLREMPSNTTVVGERRIERTAGASRAILVIAAEPLVQKSCESPRALFDEQRGGLGLILPLARRVIERHGGQIWSPSDERGRGAAIISLPVPELNS